MNQILSSDESFKVMSGAYSVNSLIYLGGEEEIETLKLTGSLTLGSLSFDLGRKGNSFFQFCFQG